MWRFHWEKYGGRRMGKILLDSAVGIEKWRGALALWGGTLAVLLFFGTPLGDAIMSTWHLLPWWTVPVFLLASLVAFFVRGLIKANHEEFLKVEQSDERSKAEKEALEEKLAEAVRESERLRAEKERLRDGLILADARLESAVVAEVDRKGPVVFSQVTVGPNANVTWAGPRVPAPGHYPVPYNHQAPAAYVEVQGTKDAYRVALAYEARSLGDYPGGLLPDFLRSAWTVQTTTHVQVLDKDGNEVRYPVVYSGRASVSKDGSVGYVVSCDWTLSGLPQGVYALNVFDYAEGIGVGAPDHSTAIAAREYRDMRLKVSKLVA